MKGTIFVTGAGGFVGRNLIPILIESGFKTIPLIRYEEEAKNLPPNIDFVVGDLSRRGKWIKKLKEAKAIIHLAAQISAKDESDFQRNNVIATTNLIKEAQKTKISKFILFSSAAVTSTRQDPYSRTKKMQERILKNSKLNHVILRPSMIYGPTDDKNIGMLINLIKKFPVIPLFGSGNYGRQPLYVDDISRIVVKILRSKKSNATLEIHGFEYVTMRRMVQTIIRVLKLKRAIINLPLAFLYLIIFVQEKIFPNPKFTSDQIRSLTSGEKFKGDEWWKIFDIIPTRFETGVKKMVTYRNVY